MTKVNNLLRADLYILFKSKAFYICLIVVLLFSIAMPFLYQLAEKQISNVSIEDKQIVEKITEVTNREGIQGLSVGFTSSAFSGTAQLNMTWFIGQILGGGMLLLVLAIFISRNMAIELSLGTIRTSISKGFSRTKIYLSKWITLEIANIILAVMMIIGGIIVTGCMFGFTQTPGQLFRMIGIELLLHIAIVSVFIMIGMVVHKKVTVVLTNILIVTVGSSIFSLISMLLKDTLILNRYWIPSNITEMGEIVVSNEAITRSILCAIVYIVVSTIIGIQIFKRRDIN